MRVVETYMIQHVRMYVARGLPEKNGPAMPSPVVVVVVVVVWVTVCLSVCLTRRHTPARWRTRASCSRGRVQSSRTLYRQWTTRTSMIHIHTCSADTHGRHMEGSVLAESLWCWEEACSLAGGGGMSQSTETPTHNASP